MQFLFAFILVAILAIFPSFASAQVKEIHFEVVGQPTHTTEASKGETFFTSRGPARVDTTTNGVTYQGCMRVSLTRVEWSAGVIVDEIKYGRAGSADVVSTSSISLPPIFSRERGIAGLVTPEYVKWVDSETFLLLGANPCAEIEGKESPSLEWRFYPLQNKKHYIRIVRKSPGIFEFYCGEFE